MSTARTVAKHTCWDDPDFDGMMRDACAGCDLAEAHPCRYCGYGHVFTTHNPTAHAENGDPVAAALGESAWADRFCDGPYVG